MAGTQSKAVDQILEDVMSNVYDNYKYFSVDTGTTSIENSDVNLENGGTQIGITPDLYNKIREDGTTDSKLDGRSAVWKWKLTSGEPNNLPINIGQLGLMKTQGKADSLGIGAKLPVAKTKDNQSQWVIRMTSKAKRRGE